MKKIFVLVFSIALLTSCDKTYICNCGSDQGGLPYKKIYLKAKTENGAEKQCTKAEESGEACMLQ